MNNIKIYNIKWAAVVYCCVQNEIATSSTISLFFFRNSFYFMFKCWICIKEQIDEQKKKEKWLPWRLG